MTDHTAADADQIGPPSRSNVTMIDAGSDAVHTEGGTTSAETERVFRRLVANTLITGVTSSFLWFAVTFWVYLETRSVVATGVIGAAFGLSSALIGPAFGTFVDRHRKHWAMVVATAVSAGCFVAATLVFVVIDADTLLELGSPWFWILIALTLLGSVAGQMRAIPLSTCVTLLVPADRRDRANGLVGTVTGLSFAITSVFSGLVIGRLGHGLGAVRLGRPRRRRPRAPHQHPLRRAGARAQRRRADVARRHPRRGARRSVPFPDCAC